MLRSIDDPGAEYGVRVLSTVVGMVPAGSIGICFESVCEGFARCNWTLCDCMGIRT